MRGYSYGFNSYERDDEIKGKGNSYDYEYRMNDPRLGRFFASDSLASDGSVSDYLLFIFLRI